MTRHTPERSTEQLRTCRVCVLAPAGCGAWPGWAGERRWGAQLRHRRRLLPLPPGPRRPASCCRAGSCLSSVKLLHRGARAGGNRARRWDGPCRAGRLAAPRGAPIKWSSDTACAIGAGMRSGVTQRRGWVVSAPDGRLRRPGLIRCSQCDGCKGHGWHTVTAQPKCEAELAPPPGHCLTSHCNRHIPKVGSAFAPLSPTTT